MIRSTNALRVAALAGAVALVLTACSSSDGTGDASPAAAPLIVGTLLPQTGSLAFLGPPEIAGVGLAVKEINAAGGVLGADVKLENADSSDADNAEIATQSVTDLKSKKVQVIIGAASSAVTRNVVEDITNAKIVQISPANTATDLSGKSPFYFRTAPSDILQGAALGKLITGDGHANIGVLVFNDDYGTSLRDVLKTTVEAAGATISYGNQGQEFDPKATSFADPVTAVLATNPDAIAIIAFAQTKQIIPELVAKGYDMKNVYFVDGNLSDYSKDFQPGTLEGVQGTLPGAFPDDAFQKKLLAVDPALKDYSYAAESYDATTLAALAAVKGGATDGVTIQKNLAAVSGADGGTECTGFKECADLLAAGKDIDYNAVSGAGSFNAQNDPSTALIGVYQYGADNKYTFIKSEAGSL
ncbi:ABC transporter substrate-binding protein [Pengzhenrongella phosphoraccumulans]|jgi:ABC-type branched-subunit amino acid transport system substrate-binding protein|uniref:ABC transporter substrate-binding protein n=1 Tax=Pengzhenrongella phosphoraccumulans TaxID=3114394 RepID=UPI00388EE7A7